MPRDPKPFVGKVVAITGGSRGLGLAVGRHLADLGADVALLDVLPEVSDSAAALSAEFGTNTVGIVTDVTAESSVEAAFDALETQLGGVTHTVCAAGVAQTVSALEVSAGDFRRVIDINLTGTFITARAAARRMIRGARAGAIVNFGSMSGYVANRPQDQAAYNASKAGVTMLTKSLAVEWLEHGIRVNSVAPGYMASDMTRQFVEANPAVLREWESRTPMGRMGQPTELTGLVAFLLGEESSYITGQDYLIDGGYTLV